MNNLKALLSIEERKTSAMIICLLLLVLFIITMNWLGRSIFSGMVDIIQTLIVGIVGINGLDAVDKYVNYRNKIKDASVEEEK